MALTLSQKKLLRETEETFESDLKALMVDLANEEIGYEEYRKCYHNLQSNYDNDVLTIRAGVDIHGYA